MHNLELLLSILREDFGYGLFEDDGIFDTLDRAYTDGTITLRDYTEAIQCFKNKEEAK